MERINTRKYYSTIRRNEIPIHATTWIDLENINLKKAWHKMSNKYCMILLMRCPE
jgi:hypothetical protein